ncbi:hypothetical protein DITRI_Ditri10aG0087600 [Diplodiscus trichospermus]
MNAKLSMLKVNDLMVPSCWEWDIECINDLFSSRDRDAILSIPLCYGAMSDECIWHFSKDGSYTLNIPSKIKNFVWRAAREVLPNRDTLRSQGVNIPIECVFCAHAIENSWHLFLRCGFAQSCWHAAGLDNIIDNLASSADSFIQWLFDVIGSVKDPMSSKIMKILWSIWRERNERLWKNVQRSPDLVVLNAVFYESVETGLGAILRDTAGELVAYKGIRLPGLLAVKECEALVWVRSMSYSTVIFETDCKEVVDALRRYVPNDTEFGIILSKCHPLLCSEPSFKVVHLRRSANGAAHAVARRSHFVQSPAIGFECPDWLTDPLRSFCIFLIK